MKDTRGPSGAKGPPPATLVPRPSRSATRAQALTHLPLGPTWRKPLPGCHGNRPSLQLVSF